MMAQRLLEVEVSLSEVLIELNIDSLLTSEWVKLDGTCVQDLISAPASQTFAERIFAVCGLLTEGRRNRITKSLEQRVFLRLNATLFRDSDM